MTIDIFSKEFVNAMDAIQKRSDLNTISNVEESFVDMGGYTVLCKPESQIVKGRRGTGKSHLLLYNNSILEKSFKEERILSCYINLEESFMDIKEQTLTDQELGTYLFNNLLTIIVKRMYRFTNTYLKPNFLEKVFGIGAPEKRSELHSQMDKLSWIATYGSPVFLTKKTLEILKHNRKQTHKSKEDLSFTAGGTWGHGVKSADGLPGKMSRFCIITLCY